jgi:hypothetical protein
VPTSPPALNVAVVVARTGAHIVADLLGIRARGRGNDEARRSIAALEVATGVVPASLQLSGAASRALGLGWEGGNGIDATEGAGGLLSVHEPKVRCLVGLREQRLTRGRPGESQGERQMLRQQLPAR